MTEHVTISIYEVVLLQPVQDYGLCPVKETTDSDTNEENMHIHACVRIHTHVCYTQAKRPRISSLNLLQIHCVSLTALSPHFRTLTVTRGTL